ncbi:2,2-dialkylglycine decarboxylase [Cladobotryum mycophilum]|uniref:2,2-dialkylglycine decarboxylase n=1 Tax=Cladobotryum mycophilum TaxID=491253 RepID=A0ABR0SSW0_9HYPO
MPEQQQQQSQGERPYRSHLRPACVPCRRRKSRCQTETNASACLMCRAHRTDCYFPGDSRRSEGTPESGRRSRRREARSSTLASGPGATRTTARTPTPLHGTSPVVQCLTQSRHNTQEDESLMALSSADDQHHNLHIVGPVVTNDSHVLSNYLSGIPGATRSTRMMIPESASRSRPVLFTEVQKRPVGIQAHRSPSAEKLEIIERLLEPHTQHVINEYFDKVNTCFPLLDEVSFRRQFNDDKSRISPALMACLYAHTTIYWQYSPILSNYRCPDSRFIWNLANEAVYSELHLSPGMSTIKAILLNIGGRPTTSLIGNGVLLGSAVSMAHSLGLNHNPLPWKIPQPEKYLRMKIWWALLVHDRWTSLAHGTPPLISRSQYDVPPPTLEYLCDDTATESKHRTASIFIALVGLTDVLDQHLQHVYHIGRDKPWNTTNLELSLNAWVETLSGSCRLIVIRGSRLDIPGAANLRLAYLTARLLLQRIELEEDKQSYESNESRLMNRYSQARQTAEEILMLTQEFQPEHLGDFWLPISAFTYPATVNFLLRCALETENSPEGLAQSGSFRIVRDLIATLRCHQEKYGWELGDVCLAQHAELVEKILAGVALDEQGQGSNNNSNNDGGSAMDIQDFIMPDSSILDQFFPSLWDPLQKQPDLLPTLYHGYNQEKAVQKTKKYLANYGTKFHQDVVTGAQGLYIYTASGHRVLDWTSGQMSCLLGHGHPEIVKTIVDHAMYLDHLFSGMVSPPVISLAERFLFLSTGGESNEAAIKMAKVYTGKFEIVGLAASWHGMTGQALGAQYHFGRKGQGPMIPGQFMLPAPNAYRSEFRKPDGSYDWEAELNYGWRMIDLQSCGSLAACIVECIQSSGGMHVLPPGYLKALKKHCEARGMLLIVDEAQTGVGRCGDFMAINHEDVVPDILTLSKTLGNGLPLSAVVTSNEIESVCDERGYMFYTTHVNDPLPAAVGDKVLEIVFRDNLIPHACQLGALLHQGLEGLKSRYACIGDVRGRGLMAGIEIVADRRTGKEPALELARKIGDRAYELGVWANLSSHPSFGGTFRIAPPITVTRGQVEEGLGMLERAFAETEGTLALY